MMMMMMMPWSLTTSTIGGEKNWFKWGNRDLNKIHSNLLFRLKSAWQHSNSKGKKQIRSWVNFNGHHVHPKRKTSHHQKKNCVQTIFWGQVSCLPTKKKKRSPTYYFHQAGVKPPDVPSDDFIHPYVSHLHCQIQSPLDLKNCREWILFVPDG